MSFLGKVAIIGRPNVGKSSLFNRLIGKKIALVNDRSGVTRDRREGLASLGDLEFLIIDTAGLDVGVTPPLAQRMHLQTEAAIDMADIIFFLVDAQTELTASDYALATRLRLCQKPLILLGNKSDTGEARKNFYRLFELGLGDPLLISAAHNDGLDDLYERLRPLLTSMAASKSICSVSGAIKKDNNEESEESEGFIDGSSAGSSENTSGAEAPMTDIMLGDRQSPAQHRPQRPLNIAVVGRPNVGKSTLLNAILGEERFVTGPEPGITRDSLSVRYHWRGHELALWDTAGLRKRAYVQDELEKLAWQDSLRAIDFAEVVILLLDIASGPEKQDLMIAERLLSEGRALVIALNKIDQLEEEEKGHIMTQRRQEVLHALPQVYNPKIIPVSAQQKRGLTLLLQAVQETHIVWNQRVPTAKLNYWLQSVVADVPPPLAKGRRIKIRYITQNKTRPPHFTIFGNQLEAVPDSYERFLLKGIKEQFNFFGVPVRLSRRTSVNPYVTGKR